MCEGHPGSGWNKQAASGEEADHTKDEQDGPDKGAAAAKAGRTSQKTLETDKLLRARTAEETQPQRGVRG